MLQLPCCVEQSDFLILSDKMSLTQLYAEPEEAEEGQSLPGLPPSRHHSTKNINITIIN